jgi:hypothetical protein
MATRDALELAPLLPAALAARVRSEAPPAADACAVAVAAALADAPAFRAMVATLTEARGSCAKDADGAGAQRLAPL